MFGCYIMLFVRSDNYNCIKSMHTVKIKTGTSGYTANKGSVALRFNFEDTSFMFMNCHLCSG
jgi:inositol-1,4,5-trisphosphate 5-phosphatase